MKFRVKDMDIATGRIAVAILNQRDAQLMDLQPMDRVLLEYKNKKIVAVLDIAESERAVPKGIIGLFEETLDALGVTHGREISFSLAKKPESLHLVQKKLAGGTLTYSEYLTIMKDIASDVLTDIELTAFVISNMNLDMKEIVALTKAMRDCGEILSFDRRGKLIVDIHSIGGVPGNRITIVVVPILIAAGLIVPKTSTRAITSPAGTADTMEVLCSVEHSLKKLKQLASTVGGFIVWGGAVNLSPADDKIIQVERPLSIDAEGQMLASIMSKKASVSPTHLVLEIATGKGAKVKTRAHAQQLKKSFEQLGDLLGVHTKVLLTDGSQPVGNGMGCVLEMRDCLLVLQNNRQGPQDLRERSLRFAGETLEFTKKAAKGKGYALAKELLESGEALKAFERMVKAQGGVMKNPHELRLGTYSHTVVAHKAGRVHHIDNHTMAHIARIAGAPQDKEAGVYMPIRLKMKVNKGDTLFTMYSDNKTKLAFALDAWKREDGITIV